MPERVHTITAVKRRGEAFTPSVLVNQVLDQALSIKPDDNNSKTFLDNSCGNGNFLIEILKRKMTNGASHEQALSTIYGVDISKRNINECRKRLSLGKKDKPIWEILNRNIICADALNPNHNGWKIIGYMWDPAKAWADAEDFISSE